MKAWAKSFYLSAAWEQTRAAYLMSQDYICERCGQPAKIVHHKHCYAMLGQLRGVVPRLPQQRTPQAGEA